MGEDIAAAFLAGRDLAADLMSSAIDTAGEVDARDDVRGVQVAERRQQPIGAEEIRPGSPVFEVGLGLFDDDPADVGEIFPR